MAAPLSVHLNLAAYYTRESGQFVLSCPAIKLAAQGKTLAKAKQQFFALLQANVEYWQRHGHFAEVLRTALAAPDSRIVPAGARRQPLSFEVPPELLAATYGPKQETQRRKGA